MTAEEFLIQQWNKCIWMVHEDYPENILMICDPIHTRKMKLNSLDKNINIEFKKSDDTKILFYQDHKNGYFDVNYSLIWSVLEYHYKLNYKEIIHLIRNILLEDNKLKQSTTMFQHLNLEIVLLEDNKLKQLTTAAVQARGKEILLEDNKLKQLTTL